MYEGQVGVSCMRGDVARRAPNRSDMCFYFNFRNNFGISGILQHFNIQGEQCDSDISKIR